MLTTQELSRIVIAVSGCLVMQASYTRLTYVVNDPLTDLLRGWSFGCSVEGRWVQPRHSACSTLLTVWTDANRGFLATEILSFFQRLGMYYAIFYVPQNDPLSSDQVDKPCVNSVKCTLFSMATSEVLCISSSLSVCCILPNRIGIRNFFAALLVGIT